MILKILTVLFALFAIARVVVRYRRGGALTAEILFWGLIWAGLGAVVFVPQKTDYFARFIGVSSGFNALTFIAIAGLLFAVYRLFARVATLQQDLTRMVRILAIDNAERPAAERQPPSNSA
jgi:hypothetical protein